MYVLSPKNEKYGEDGFNTLFMLAVNIFFSGSRTLLVLYYLIKIFVILIIIKPYILITVKQYK